MDEKELLKLKSDIDKAKITVSELNGQNNALMKQLQDDWSCKTIAESEEKLKEMDDSISSIDKKIEKGIEELENKYEV